MVKWVLKAVASLLMSGIIRFYWDISNAKPIFDMLSKALEDGKLTGRELGAILDKIAEEL